MFEVLSRLLKEKPIKKFSNLDMDYLKVDNSIKIKVMKNIINDFYIIENLKELSDNQLVLKYNSIIQNYSLNTNANYIKKIHSLVIKETDFLFNQL